MKPPSRSTRARRACCMLLAAALCVAGTSAHAALHVADSDIGQVLIFPYYTVDGGNQTLFSVENTTPRAKAVAIRFREARNGALVHALNAYLAPNAGIRLGIVAMSETSAPIIIQLDSGCTYPEFARGRQGPFSTAAFTGAFRDHPVDLAASLGGLDRTRSGYFEVFDMGDLRAGSLPGELGDEVSPVPFPVGRDYGQPRACAAIAAAWEPGRGVWSRDAGAGLDLPSGGLRGSASIANPAKGTMSTFAPIALGGFYTDGLDPGALHARPADDRPRLSDARSSATEVVVEVRDLLGRTLTETFPAQPASSDPVSLVLMGSRLSGEYNIDPFMDSRTEWVLALPTKRDHVNGSGPRAPFTTQFPSLGRAAERFVVYAFDDAGRPHGDVRFCGRGDPAPPCQEFEATNSINVVSFTRAPATGRTPLLGAMIGTTASNVVLDAHSELCERQPLCAVGPCAGIFNDLRTTGRIDMAFGAYDTTLPSDPATSINSLLAPSGRRYYGLPAVATSFTQLECKGCIANATAGFGAERGVAKVLQADH